MTTATAWTRRDVLRKHRVVMVKKTYGAGDTSVTVATGLKIIYSYEVSPTATAGDYVTRGVVSGGTITLTVSDSTPDSSYVFVTAFGL